MLGRVPLELRFLPFPNARQLTLRVEARLHPFAMPSPDRIARGSSLAPFSLRIKYFLGDVRYRRPPAALALEAAVIDPRREAGLTQRLVGHLRPTLAERQIFVARGPKPSLVPLASA